MINAYPFFRSICIVSLFLFLYFNSFAQNFPISGKIINAEGQPLAGVTIQVKGSNATAQTNPDGTFRINVPSSGSVLVASYVGFAEQQIPVNNQSQLNVTMTPQNISLQDVVVVGYGTKRRGDVTGAISTVSSEKIKSVPVTNVTQALQGRVAGVDANMSSLRPGAGATIRIRGNRSLGATNEPLYVVDGIPQSYSIDDLNPLDIESMDVLKDAAATAIYGVRGANGVIQITTKKGKTGKISVNYQGSQSIEEMLRPVQVFNSVELSDAWRQAFFADKQYTATRGVASSTNPLFYYPTAIADIALFRDRFGSEDQWNSIKDAYTWR